MDISLPSLKSPTDVLAVVPYLFGFSPERSLVVMGLRSRLVVFQARVDLPGPGDEETVAGQLAAVVARQRVDAAVLVAYGSGAEATPTMDAARRALEARGITIKDALRADEGRYWSYVCQRPDCCPPEGTPYDVASTAVAAEATYAGLSPAASRAELVARLAPVEGVTRIAMRAATHRADRRLNRLLDDAEATIAGGAASDSDEAWRAITNAARDAVYAAGIAAVDAANARLGAIASPDDDAVAWLSVLLASRQVRDYAWERIGRDVTGSVTLWTDIVRRVEPEFAAPPATLLAYAAWRSGDGAIASIAIDRALEADPAYPLALLVGEALANGLPPGAWLDVPARPAARPRAARRARRRTQRRLRVVPPAA